MSDLQDAIKLVDADQSDNGATGLFEARALVVEAARRYANPDMEAAKAAFSRTWSRPEVGGTEGVDGLGISLKAAVAAALGVTEDTDHRGGGLLEGHP